LTPWLWKERFAEQSRKAALDPEVKNALPSPLTGQRLMPGGWWVALFPGILLSVTALVFHALAESPRPSEAKLS
jgi:hypothetical protein